MAINTASVNNKDTYLDSYLPTANAGASTIFMVYRTSAYPISRYRPLIHFTLPSGSGTITAVKLCLYKYGDISGWTCPAVQVHELTRTDWVELEATWNIYKTGFNWTTPGGDYSATIVDTTNSPLPQGTYGWEKWDLGVGAANPISGLTWGSNVHLYLRYPTSSTVDSCARWYSRENATNKPYIEITYTPPAGFSRGYIIG